MHVFINLSKPKSTTPRTYLNVNCRLWVMTCQYRYKCNQSTTLVGDVYNGEGCACGGGAGTYEESLHFLLRFAVSLKLLYKKKKKRKVVHFLKSQIAFIFGFFQHFHLSLRLRAVLMNPLPHYGKLFTSFCF